MRPPARTTRSSRRLSDAEDTPSPETLPVNFKIAHKPVVRAVSHTSKQSTQYGEKKPRHRMTDKQLGRLEALYQQDTHPNREQKQALGEEVGMDTRTVTVWFQNRRQLSKKQSMILGSTPQALCRQPLHTTHKNNEATSRQPSVSSASQMSAPQTPLFYPSSRQQSKRLELWEHLPSSPVTNTTVSAATSAMPSPLAKRFPNISGIRSGASKENDATRKRKPILEWACARVAKRQRVETVAEDEEVTEDESDLDVTLVDLDSRQEADKLVKIKSPETGRCKNVALPGPKSTVVSIPAKYNKNFAPDVVLGASLLLTFQQSSRLPAATC